MQRTLTWRVGILRRSGFGFVADGVVEQGTPGCAFYPNTAPVTEASFFISFPPETTRDFRYTKPVPPSE